MKRWSQAITSTALLPTLAVLLSAAASAAQEVGGPAGAAESAAPVRALPGVRTAAPPTLDGRLDDDAWAAAPVARGFTQARPHAGAPASEQTEVRILYDDAAVYVGARLYDARPDSVVARLARRDQDFYSDWFGVGLDSYHDRRTAFLFWVNPRGVQRDVMLYDDTRDDPSWDAVWEVATRVDSLGWTAELRIPLSQLRFDARRAEQTWGLNLVRRIARRDELAHWSPVPPDASGEVSRYGELRGLSRLRPAHRLEVQPYTVGRLTRAPGDPGNPFHRASDLFGSVGADLKYGVTSDLTLSATLNPDFGQVEADPAVINLTAFESYFEEKRPFFTEGSEIFGHRGPAALFYSRRIGRAPQGRLPAGVRHAERPDATTILGAAKLTGKTASGWSIGALSALAGAAHARYADAAGTLGHATVEPLTHYGVARVSRDFRAGQSALGGILTATTRRLEEHPGLGALASDAYAGGIDGRHRFGGGDYQVSGALLASRVLGSDSAVAAVQRSSVRYFQRPDAAHLDYDPSRTSLAGYAAEMALAKIGGSWRWSVHGSVVSPGFEVNDLGFLFNADQITENTRLGYYRFRPGPLFRSWSVNLGQYLMHTTGGEVLDGALYGNFDFQLHSQWGASVGYMRHYASLVPSALRGGPAVARPARHMGMNTLYSDRRRPVTFRLSSFWETEDGTGGYRLTLNPSLGVRPSNRAELSLQPGLSWTADAWQYVGRRDLGGEPRYLVAQLRQRVASLTARLDYTFTPALSLQLYAQPFVGAAEFSEFREVRDPRAARFDDRFHTYGPDQIDGASEPGKARVLRVDADRDGAVDFTFRDPSFNARHFRSNAVLRWEYRPGSTLFLVWSQGRNDRVPDGSLDLGRDLGRLFETPASNVFLVKLSYWLGM